MEPPKCEGPKLLDMVMCGDHPSFTKTDPTKEANKKTSYARVSPSTSRTGGGGGVGACAGGAGERVARNSEHALRLGDARRRVRSLEAVPRADIEPNPANRALFQAALGSFRWPPYLLCVWVVVLVLTHVLHCAVTMLERALPNVKKFCLYFRQWTEEAWKTETDINQRVYPLMLALVTGLLYALYYTLYVLYSVAVWSIEPLCADLDDKQSAMDVFEAKVTNYVDEVASKSNLKHT